MSYLSHPVTWQLVSFPLRGLNAPLVFNRSACNAYKSTLLRHGRAGPDGSEGGECRGGGADRAGGGMVAGQSVSDGEPSSSSSSMDAS